MLRRRPCAFVSTFVPVSMRDVALGLPQYPFWPGAGPSRGLPSGQRGTGRTGRLDAGSNANLADSETFSILFPVALKTTESPQIWRVPFLAVMPCTAISSPGFTVFNFQPLLS